MPTILGAGDSDTGYEIDNGLVFNGVNQYMTHTRGTATDEKLFTFSAWIKLGQAGKEDIGTGGVALRKFTTFNEIRTDGTTGPVKALIDTETFEVEVEDM